MSSRAGVSDASLLGAVGRVAAAAAAGVHSYELAERVAVEVVDLLGAAACTIFRYDGDEIVMVGGAAQPGQRVFTRGMRAPVAESYISKEIRETGEPARQSDYVNIDGEGPRRVALLGYRTVIGAPIRVEGGLWGTALAACSDPDQLPPGSEQRLAVLADLCAVAVASAERLSRLEAQTAEQGALLSVARSVVESQEGEDVLQAIAREAAQLLGVASGAVVRFREARADVAAEWHAEPHEPLTLPEPIVDVVRELRAVVRMGDPDVTAETPERRVLGHEFGWGAPLQIENELWGAVVVGGTRGIHVPPDAQRRLERFAHLSALAVAHVEARAALLDELVRSEQFRALVEGSDDFIAFADMDGNCLYVNPAGRALLGIPTIEAALTSEIEEFYAEEWRATEREVERPTVREQGSWQGEGLLRHFQTGESIPVSINSFLITHPVSGEPLFFATVQRDLRERKEAEAQLRRRAEEVEELAGARRFLLVEALSAEERMRRQIGDALHDDVLQELYAAKQDLAEIDADDEALHRARIAVDAASRQLRDAVRDLHPAVSWTRDLETRLRSILEEGQARAGFDARLDYAAGVESGAEDLLLALARELVQNVIKHADAHSVRVTVRDDDSGVLLEVADDGRGMPAGRPSEALRSGHIGLASARERVDALGGRFELASEPGAGTRVRVTIPSGSLSELAPGGR